ncbi:FAD-dependent oxidoreductase, partial [Candidatus Bathyarchaeota archaeon]|nr:FAD-dependent oxidoreductase [Candidatus Bathyarchaeota archaeon]
MLKKHGNQGAQAAADSHTWALNHVGKVSERLGIECEYRHLPGYEISQYEQSDSRHEEDMKHLKEEAETAKKLGLDAQFNPELTVRGWDGKVNQRGGAVFANQATFHPTRYLVGILNWLREHHNFRCFARTRVMAVDERSWVSMKGNTTSVTVETEDGRTIGCNNAVEATNIPLQKLSVVAELDYNRTYAIAIRVPKGSVEDCLFYDTAEAYKYARLTPCDEKDDYLVVGGCDHEVGRATSEGRFEELEGWVRERFTKAGAVDYKWSGQINEPIDFMAFIGKNQGCQNTYIATGDSGNGLTHGVIAGRLIADEIEGKENPWSKLYSPKRIGTIAKSLPALAGNVISINSQYKRLAQSDIGDIEDLAPGQGGVLNPLLSKPMAIYKAEDGKVTQMSALCPHMK